MRKCMAFVTLSALSRVSGRCPNDCNAKGQCNSLNQCECFPNFRGPDCSFRICPAGKAFIDTPLGDVDGDGDVGIDLVYMQGISRQPVSETLHVDYAAARPAFMSTKPWDEAHFYAECSNKGDCNPLDGICECYPGYDGSACNRHACPDDCSGHGTCKTYEGSTYAGWDVAATTYCNCDARWSGPSCSMRVCRQGVDPVETANVDTSRMQRIAFRTLGPLQWDDDSFDMGAYPFGDLFFSLTATDEYGDEWTTEIMTVKYDMFYAENAIVAQVYFQPRLLTNSETIGKYSRRHVADTVEDALEALPHNCMGDISVSEIYTMVGLVDLDDEFDSFTFYETDYTDMGCDLMDIYDYAGSIVNASKHVVGCGVPSADQYLGVNSGDARNGGLDINQFLEDENSYIMLTGTRDRFEAASFDSPIVILADTDDIAPGDEAGAPLHKNVGNSAGEIFSFGYAYYMYPHYNNDDSPSTRFPLMGDPNVLTSDYYTEEYSSIFLFDIDSEVSALDESSTNYMAGLGIFIRFEKTTIETLLRVDYYFANEHILFFEQFKSSTSSSWQALLAMEPYLSTKGTTQEGCTDPLCSNDYELVTVDNIGSRRSWDELYHGLRQYFLGDGNIGADAELHECSKRGICDFESGVCQCFSGYAGLDCGTLNALAYGI